MAPNTSEHHIRWMVRGSRPNLGAKGTLPLSTSFSYIQKKVAVVWLVW